MNKKWSRKPSRRIRCWIEFICTDGAKPAIVESLNGSGGICTGQQYKCWDFEGEFYAIRNQAGNAVWCHKNNLKLISAGTVSALAGKV